MAAFAEYLGVWHFPGGLAGLSRHGKLSCILSKERWESHKDAQHIKCSASEGLSCMQLLAAFCSMLLEGRRPEKEKAHARCYLRMVHLVELLRRAAKEVIDARVYLSAAAAFLDSFRQVHGPELMTPKFHSVLHFGWFMGKWGRLPNCFCLERKHKGVKRWLCNVYVAIACRCCSTGAPTLTTAGITGLQHLRLA